MKFLNSIFFFSSTTVVCLYINKWDLVCAIQRVLCISEPFFLFFPSSEGGQRTGDDLSLSVYMYVCGFCDHRGVMLRERPSFFLLFVSELLLPPPLFVFMYMFSATVGGGDCALVYVRTTDSCVCTASKLHLKLTQTQFSLILFRLHHFCVHKAFRLLSSCSFPQTRSSISLYDWFQPSSSSSTSPLEDTLLFATTKLSSTPLTYCLTDVPTVAQLEVVLFFFQMMTLLPTHC